MKTSEILNYPADQTYREGQWCESPGFVSQLGIVDKSNGVSIESKDSKRFGILIVDNERRMVSLNRAFIQMWRLPERIIASQNDDLALAFVAEQVEQPCCFLMKVRGVYVQKAAIIQDTIKLKDGRVFERFSQPQWLGQQIVGRVWLFREYTLLGDD